MQRAQWRYILHIAVGSYLIGAFMWSMPPEIPMKRRVDRFFQPSFQWLGLWQNWQMFAPDPRRDDIFVDGQVTLADGRTIERNLSRMWVLPLFEQYRRERWRKLFNDYIRTDKYKRHWPAIGEWLMRDVSDQETSPAVHVELRRHWREAKPDLPGGDTEKNWQMMKFYEAGVMK